MAAQPNRTQSMTSIYPAKGGLQPIRQVRLLRARGRAPDRKITDPCDPDRRFGYWPGL